ncbi:unnamed protein product [Clavelina lepadiformis]|uniref:Uncharacterized protein n=1 Tax=Clavelina lepadiformis TaxID=159417 RepID=A0ABP0GJW6_CLALP
MLKKFQEVSQIRKLNPTQMTTHQGCVVDHHNDISESSVEVELLLAVQCKKELADDNWIIIETNGGSRSSCGGVAGKPAASRACRGQDAPVEALDKAQVFHGRRVPPRFQDTLSIDVLNANCGLGLIPGPRPPQGRLKSNPGAPVARANAESDGDLCLRRPVEVSKGPARDRRARRRRIDLEEVSSFRQVAAIDRECRRSSARVTSLTFRPEVGRDYPLNLSILLSGGKETNEDSLSKGE